MLRVYKIDNYDDLLYPGHRLLAQIALVASNESPNDVSAVENVSIAQCFHCFVVTSYYPL